MTRAHSEASKRWQRSHPEANSAHGAVTYALKTGRLVKPAKCAHCDKITSVLYAHHAHGYLENAKLDIIWLCLTCHRAEHAAMVGAAGTLTCRRCGHCWYPRKPGRSLTCPNCRSPYWDRKRKRERSKDGR